LLKLRGKKVLIIKKSSGKNKENKQQYKSRDCKSLTKNILQEDFKILKKIIGDIFFLLRLRVFHLL